MSEVIRDAVTQSASSSVDGISETNRSISELIEADRYLSSKSAVRKKQRGLMISKIVPPGAN
jgi:hypothetical protein